MLDPSHRSGKPGVCPTLLGQSKDHNFPHIKNISTIQNEGRRHRSRLLVIYLFAQNNDNFSDRSASGWHTLPAPLDNLPHTIREFRTLRTGWSTAVQHRVDSCDPTLIGERNSPGKNLGASLAPSNIPFMRRSSVGLTSQVRTPNAYMSLSFVGPVSVNPEL
jgi:hypothetical protein